MSGGGGGSGAPATVSPTANTSTVQHASNQAGKGGGGAGIPAVDTTSTFPDQTGGVDGGAGAGGGKAGGGGVAPPQNDIQFGGYGQQSPFGLTNPASWGESGGADLTGTTSSNVTNQFTGSDFYNQQSPQQVAEAAAVEDNSSGAADNTPTAGAIDTGAGTTLNYDAGEQQAAQNIANTIEAGGINAATGDNNISAGPNVLSAGDDGLFGFGNDYNDEFQQNYAAQSAHAAANPYGQSTGTPLSQQGFVQEGGLADTFINNSTIGTIGSALTGKNLISTTADLLPPPLGSVDERDAAGEYGKTGEVPAEPYIPSANPNQAAADAHAAVTSGSKGQERAESAAQAQANVVRAAAVQSFGGGKQGEQAYLNADKARRDAAIAAAGGEQAWLNAGARYNKGGKVTHRNSSGGK